MHPIESTKRKRRTYSKRFKAELVAECLTGEDSIASIALRHDSIASKRDLPVKASLYPCPRWLIGWVNAVMPCNPWSMPCVKRYCKSLSCMRMKPPSRSCVRTKTEKHTGPTSGPMLRRFMKGSMPSLTTLPQAGQALMPAPSWLIGKASSSPMTTAVINKASSKAG